MVLSFLRHPAVTSVPVTPAIWRHVSAYTWPDLARVDAIGKALEAMRTAARRYHVAAATA